MDPRTSFNFVGSKKYASVDNSLDATNSILHLTQENVAFQIITHCHYCYL